MRPWTSRSRDGRVPFRTLSGEVAEWSKALDWNSSNVQKAFVGSNPTLSANNAQRPASRGVRVIGVIGNPRCRMAGIRVTLNS